MSLLVLLRTYKRAMFRDIVHPLTTGVIHITLLEFDRSFALFGSEAPLRFYLIHLQRDCILNIKIRPGRNILHFDFSINLVPKLRKFELGR